MINFELVGGVNFRKGCYPGQEIVARSQYLGKLKRRMGLAHVAGPDAVAPMQDVFAGEAKDPVGLVAEAVPHEGGWLVLFEAPVSVQESGDLRLAEGRRVQPLPLPYELVDVTA
jgi:folate-binding Fe-S cluster repair protein YgfZ